MTPSRQCDGLHLALSSSPLSLSALTAFIQSVSSLTSRHVHSEHSGGAGHVMVCAGCTVGEGRLEDIMRTPCSALGNNFNITHYTEHFTQ